MHYTYCTLFDKNYLSQALCLYNSLKTTSKDFTLHMLALDSVSYEYLTNQKLPNIVPYSLESVETKYPVLQRVKPTRSRAEYCWTLTPFSIAYVIETYNAEHCTYLDADIYFFNSPEILYNPQKSVIITRHNYTPQYDDSTTSGFYCVQFMYFKNDANGLTALHWWKDRCAEWCFKRREDGKFGDQKYLDDWTTRFDSVHVPPEIGCGVAPWNIQKCDFFVDGTTIMMTDKITKQTSPVIFFHFANIRQLNKKNQWLVSFYETSEEVKKLIYTPYFLLLQNIQKELVNIIPPQQKKLKTSKPLITLKRFFDITKNDFLVFLRNFIYSKNIQRNKSMFIDLGDT